jgi:hypothetical protein
MKKGGQDYLADIWAPFLIEIPRGHFAFNMGTTPPYLLHPQNDMHASYSRRTLYITLESVNALSYYQPGLYGCCEEKH